MLHYDVLVDKLKNKVRGTMKKEKDLEKQRDEEKHEEDGWKKSLEAYDKVMQDWIGEGIVERVTEIEKCVDIQKSKKVFYLPHRPVIRESVESTKLRIAYNASAKASKRTVFLNEYLETGPPLQNSFYGILVRSRMRPIILCEDIKRPSGKSESENLRKIR